LLETVFGVVPTARRSRRVISEKRLSDARPNR
jgi:hypothetical protein